MKLIQAILPKSLDKFEIEIFSDLHIGSKKCNIELINKRIERVKNNKNVYCVLLGDIVNNTTRDSVGDVYDEPLSPMDQMKLASSLFEPIKDKILAITAGNHERRSYRTEGTDLTWFLARQLGCEEKYDYCSCVLYIKFGSDSNRSSQKGQYNVTIYMTHGDGTNGGTMGAKANGLQRRGTIIDADIILTGHTHQPMVFRQTSYQIAKHSNRPAVVEHEQVFVNASSTLDYEEYAELKGMKPGSTKSPVIKIEGLAQRHRAALIDVTL